MIKVIILTLLVEALVELFFKAAPLQSIRQWLIRKTPYLTSVDQGNLFDCKYCVSFWVALVVVLLGFYADCLVTRIISYIIVVARVSNFIHIIFGTIKDAQMNMRLERK